MPPSERVSTRLELRCIDLTRLMQVLGRWARTQLTGGFGLMRDPPPIVRNLESQAPWRSTQKHVLSFGRDPEKFGQELPASPDSNLAELGGIRPVEVLCLDFQPPP